MCRPPSRRPGGIASRACVLSLYDFAVPCAVEETLRLRPADVAQLAAHLSCKQGVGGSSPPVGSAFVQVTGLQVQAWSRLGACFCQDLC
jgi:hypothetical protein